MEYKTTSIDNQSSHEVSTTDNYALSKPNFTCIDKKPANYEPVVDVTSPNFDPMPTIFKVTKKNIYGKNEEVKPTPEVMMDKYFQLNLVKGFKLKATSTGKEERNVVQI